MHKPIIKDLKVETIFYARFYVDSQIKGEINTSFTSFIYSYKSNVYLERLIRRVSLSKKRPLVYHNIFLNNTNRFFFFSFECESCIFIIEKINSNSKGYQIDTHRKKNRKKKLPFTLSTEKFTINDFSLTHHNVVSIHAHHLTWKYIWPKQNKLVLLLPEIT